MTKENIRKVALAIILVLILVVIALFIGRFTYSYLGPAPTDELTGSGEVTPSGDTIIFSKDNNISLSASTDNFHTGSGNLSDSTNPQVRLIASGDTNTANTTYFAGIRIYENTYKYSTTNNTAELILSVYDENGNLLEASSDTLSFVEVGGVKGFDITEKTGAFNIAIDHPISTTSSTSGTTHTWTFTLTFVNLDTDQSINETANLEMEVVLQKDVINMPSLADVCSSGENLATCIQTLYNTYGEGYDGLYYHDADLANGAGDNSYRYAGASDEVNNYVCFGANVSTCPDENLYRVIGVFNGQVKLIKADYATSAELGTNGDYEGNYTEHLGTSDYYKGDLDQSSIGLFTWNDVNYDLAKEETGYGNVWSYSELNKTNLNTNFINSFDTTWQGMIAITKWKVGGMGYDAYESSFNVAHDYEINNPNSDVETTYNAKIGLMYVSDYLYAAQPEDWSTTMSGYATDGVINPNNNWMYMGMHEWTLSRYSDYSNYAFFVADVGELFFEYVGYGFSVRPSFYLISSTNYVSGSGSSADPIRIT